MTTKKFWLYAIALFGSAFMYFSSCEFELIPILTTTEVSDITQTTAISGGNVTFDAGTTYFYETPNVRGVCWSKNQNPTISDSKTENGRGVGSFSSCISGLEPNTLYYVRAYATNSDGTGYGSATSFKTLEEGTGAVDADGNVYSTVIIGKQEWFAENLKTTKYSNGTPIPNVTGYFDWFNLTSDAYAWYDNNEASYKNAYGALYNWNAVNTGILCPTGWRVPTDAEWTILTDYVGGEKIAGGKLKSTRTEPFAHPRWLTPNNYATNVYGFSALPGGYRFSDHYNEGPFLSMGSYGTWWSCSERSETSVWCRAIDHYYGNMTRSFTFKKYGLSVRCIKDN
jgi:uncharacterized protein (TIGR02145 family)